MVLLNWFLRFCSYICIFVIRIYFLFFIMDEEYRVILWKNFFYFVRDLEFLKLLYDLVEVFDEDDCDEVKLGSLRKN